MWGVRDSSTEPKPSKRPILTSLAGPSPSRNGRQLVKPSAQHRRAQAEGPAERYCAVYSRRKTWHLWALPGFSRHGCCFPEDLRYVGILGFPRFHCF